MVPVECGSPSSDGIEVQSRHIWTPFMSLKVIEEEKNRTIQILDIMANTICLIPNIIQIINI